MLKIFLIWKNDIRKFSKYFLSALVILFLGNLFINYCLGETTNINQNNFKQGIANHKTKTYKKFPEAPFKRIFVIENMAPLPFKKFPYKPVYKGDISDEVFNESKKIKESALNQLVSKFDLKEQKQKDRRKNEKELLVFNEEKNKKFFDYFKSIQNVRAQPANFSGFHYDYSKYLQSFKSISKR